MRNVRQAAILLSLSAAMFAGGCTRRAINLSRVPSIKPYQATYSCNPPGLGYDVTHVYRDSCGHLRQDLCGQGPMVVNVLDLNNNETVVWTDGASKYVRRPSEPIDPLMMRVRMEKLRDNPENLKEAQALGVQVVNGHRCHGWREGGSEVWFDDDYGCEVLAKSGGMTTTMTAFSPAEPDAGVFQPPKGYELAAESRRFAKRNDKGRFIRDVQMHIH